MALKINLEAAEMICRQLRLRDLGGLVINDFIDMREGAHRRMVENAMRHHLKQDKARTRICRMSPLGLIEMTRQRVKASHKDTTYDACPHCAGTGYIKSVSSQVLHLMRKIKNALAQPRATEITVTGPLALIQHVQNEKRRELADLEIEFAKDIVLNGSTAAGIKDITVTYTTDRNHTINV